MQKNKCNFYLPIAKVDKKKQMVYGYATTEALDSQGEVIEKGAIRKAWKDYMEWANVREMHQLSAVGKTKEYMHDEKGTWIGVKVIDKVAWEKVLEKVYLGFSIGGEILKKEGNRIKEIILAEISLVDRPSCPEAKFEMVKRDSSGDFINIQKVGGINITNYVMKKNKKEVVEEVVEEVVDEGKNEVTEEVVEEATEEANDTKEVIEEEIEEVTDEKEEEVKEEVEEEVEEVEEEGEEKRINHEELDDLANEKVEEAVEIEDVKKDVMEVGALSELASQLNYMTEAFKENDRQSAVTTKMSSALELLMEAIKLEAKTEVKKVNSVEELSKVITEQLEKSNAKVEELSKEIVSLKEQVDLSKKSPNRPKTIFTIEKAESEESREDVLKKGMQDILKEIEDTHNEARALMGNGDVTKEAEISKRLDSLSKRFSAQKVELSKLN